MRPEEWQRSTDYVLGLAEKMNRAEETNQMNKKEIAQAQELIDSVRRGDPPGMVEAVFPVVAKVRNAEFIAQLRQALREYSAYHVVDNLIELLRETKDKEDSLDADVLQDILSHLH